MAMQNPINLLQEATKPFGGYVKRVKNMNGKNLLIIEREDTVVLIVQEKELPMIIIF